MQQDSVWDAFILIRDFMSAVFLKINTVTVLGVPLGTLMLGFVATSMIIAVFWKGARG